MMNSVKKKKGVMLMKMKFEVEQDEELVQLPFNVSTYFEYRMNIFIFPNGKKEEFCTSTFSASILLDMAKGLIDIYEQTDRNFTVEMFESTYEYTFTYFQKLLTVTRYEGYNGETIEVLKCRFEDFVEGFVKEYKNYHTYILKNDAHAFKDEYYCMMRDQINQLHNHLNKTI